MSNSIPLQGISGRPSSLEGMNRPIGSRLSGFTLVELLTVIAIIGILAVLIVPVVTRGRDLAQRAKASNNVRQIVLSYLTFSTEGSRARSMPTAGRDAVSNIYEWARTLAVEVDLNDASLYYIEIDPYVSAASLPRLIIQRNRTTGQITDQQGWFGSPVGYEAAAGLSPRTPATTTPLIWTRGLDSSGNWNNQTSPWEGAGGHIGYLDAHVEFHRNLQGVDGQGTLIDYTTQEATANISRALNASAIIVRPNISSP